MAEDLTLIEEGTKEEKYKSLIPQITGLLYGENNLIANLANISAALKEGMGFFWVGFYLVDSEDELVLGPFQGPVACTRIKSGKGVCGSSWQRDQTLIVPNVDEFPGHIACASASKSEIVIPVKKDGKTIGVLDVDSDRLNDFDEVDQQYLQQILKLLP
ncbi:GAF domain-containing protein [Ekhidna lutea]|uniref:GAF domain-containing protein n=1 Tax=Ekhidna lutea TaxID=447679 RepID=A0A239FJ02_EKHLU|nr:GAF domain-containing protein [Ekhidna lutea]SNS56775.1 GAF domain-containing protein [Ekhidna lutea]